MHVNSCGVFSSPSTSTAGAKRQIVGSAFFVDFGLFVFARILIHVPQQLQLGSSSPCLLNLLARHFVTFSTDFCKRGATSDPSCWSIEGRTPGFAS